MSDKYLNGTEISSVEEKVDNEIVKQILPIGVTLFGAPQKLGKTLFALQLAHAVSTGNTFLGNEVIQGNVLYIAFEDSEYSIKKRFETFGLTPNVNLDILFATPGCTFNVFSEISYYKKSHPNTKVIIIDTFAKIRANPQSDYNQEYTEVARIHEIALEKDISIILITHVTKQVDYNNPFDSIYGSRGVTAAADAMMVMLKARVDEEQQELFIVGKDIMSSKLNLKRNDQLLYEVVEKEVINEGVIDEVIVKLIHYIVAKRKFEGTHEKLCSLLNLPITGRMLSVKISKNAQVLNENFIVVEKLARTSKARIISISYVGDDANDANDGV